MNRFSLTRSRGVLGLSALLLVLFAVAAASGLLRPLEQAITAVMAQVPLSRNYVIGITVLGALLPLTVRLTGFRSPAVRAVLDPYLWFLAGQLICEVAVVLLGSKGLAVLVGLVFTLLRLLQISQLWRLAAPITWLQRLMLLQMVVWGINVLQIAMNRIRPLLS